MPLYDILNEFQKGSSHMAAVVKVREKEKNIFSFSNPETIGEKTLINGDSQLTMPLLRDGKLNSVAINIDKPQINGFLTDNWKYAVDVVDDIEDREVIGIITLEDVFEELLQVNVLFGSNCFIELLNYQHNNALSVYFSLNFTLLNVFFI